MGETGGIGGGGRGGDLDRNLGVGWTGQALIDRSLLRIEAIHFRNQRCRVRHVRCVRWDGEDGVVAEVGAAEPEGGDGAEDGGDEGGDGGEQAFGVAGVLVEAAGVEGALEEGVDTAVEPCDQVAIGVEQGDVVGGYTEAGDGDEAQEGPVADEEGCRDGEQRGDAAGEEAEEADDEVADGDAGEDAVDAEGGEVEAGKGGEEEVEKKDGGGATNDAEREPVAGGAIEDAGWAAGDAGGEREDDGGADEEEEGGEDEVGEGEAVPLRVEELAVAVCGVFGVVDEDHKGDGDAAEDIDGEDAAGSGGGGLDGWCGHERDMGMIAQLRLLCTWNGWAEVMREAGLFLSDRQRAGNG